ncbi:unnamed protein product [Protopolystoma xenopodis]|uniref:Uncharacterized protein n=1 Tax=Protopolystoma xenopodis TaxID=117903 RepID=A0A448WY55_9PLAT|nr:unnamed protein product [Protopolystoma xenopodis]
MYTFFLCLRRCQSTGRLPCSSAACSSSVFSIAPSFGRDHSLGGATGQNLLTGDHFQLLRLATQQIGQYVSHHLVGYFIYACLQMGEVTSRTGSAFGGICSLAQLN